MRGENMESSQHGLGTMTKSSGNGDNDADSDRDWALPQELIDINQKRSMDIVVAKLQQQHKTTALAASYMVRTKLEEKLGNRNRFAMRIKRGVRALDGYFVKSMKHNLKGNKPPPRLQETIRKDLSRDRRISIHRSRVERVSKWLGKIDTQNNNSAQKNPAKDTNEYLGGADDEDIGMCTFDVNQSYEFAVSNGFLNGSMSSKSKQHQFDLREWLSGEQRLSMWGLDTNDVDCTQPFLNISLRQTRQPFFADAVKRITSNVAKVDFSHSPIHMQGVGLLTERLSAQLSVQEMSFSFCSLTDKHIAVLAQGLRVNTSLERLDLSHNRISVLGGEALGNILEKNGTLIELSVSHNLLGTNGFQKLVCKLDCNKTLLALDASHNGTGEMGDGEHAIASLVDAFSSPTSTCSLVHLDVKHNFFTAEDIHPLVDIINSPKQSLLGLHIAGNGNLSCVVSNGAIAVCVSEETRALPTSSRGPGFLDRSHPLDAKPDGTSCSETCYICNGWCKKTFSIKASYLPNARSVWVHIETKTGHWAPISMDFVQATNEWQLTRLVPPGIIMFYYSTNGSPVSKVSHPDLVVHRGRHLARLPIRQGVLSALDTGRDEESCWTIERSFWAQHGCEQLWDTVRPKYPDDMIEFKAVHEFLRKKQFLLVQNESNNFERDWAQVLADPIVKDHFGPGWTINDGGPTLVGLNLALEYDFPGSKDTLEYFKSVFHDYYEVLCKISTGYSGQTLPLYQLILVHAELPKTQIQKQLCELGGGFLRAILWFAKQKYEEDIENSCSKTLDVGLGFALQRFILDDLLPVVDPCWLNTDSFRRSQLYSHSVDLVLQKNRSDIVQLFKHCQQSNVVSLDRWVSILSKYALINHVCKRKHAVRAFKLSLPVRAMSISNVDTCETLGFFRFCEALGRFAALDTLILPTREELTFIGVKNTAEFYQLMALLDKELPDRAKCIWHLFEAKKQHVNLATRLGQLFQVLFCKTEGTREHVFSNHLERLDSIFERFQNQEPPLQAALAIEAFFISHATLLPHEEYNIVHQRFGI